MYPLRHIMLKVFPIHTREDHPIGAWVPARCALNTFCLILSTGGTCPRSVICRRTTLTSEREKMKEVTIIAYLAGHGSRRPVVGETCFPVKRDAIAQTCTRPTTVICHSDTGTQTILLLSTCGKVYVNQLWHSVCAAITTSAGIMSINSYVKGPYIRCDILLWIEHLELCGSRIAVIV